MVTVIEDGPAANKWAAEHRPSSAQIYIRFTNHMKPLETRYRWPLLSQTQRRCKLQGLFNVSCSGAQAQRLQFQEPGPTWSCFNLRSPEYGSRNRLHAERSEIGCKAACLRCKPIQALRVFRAFSKVLGLSWYVVVCSTIACGDPLGNQCSSDTSLQCAGCWMPAACDV